MQECIRLSIFLGSQIPEVMNCFTFVDKAVFWKICQWVFKPRNKNSQNCIEILTISFLEREIRIEVVGKLGMLMAIELATFPIAAEGVLQVL